MFIDIEYNNSIRIISANAYTISDALDSISIYFLQNAIFLYYKIEFLKSASLDELLKSKKFHLKIIQLIDRNK